MYNKKTLYGDVLITLLLIGLVVFLFWAKGEGGKCAMNPVKYIEDKGGKVCTPMSQLIEDMEGTYINTTQWLENISNG